MFGFASCGGAQERATVDTGATETTEADHETGKADVEEAADAAIQMDGLLGTIPAHSVERVMKKSEARILDCFAEAFEILEEIEGSLEIWVEVGADGSVNKTYLRDGNLGAKVAEDCIVKTVSRLKFPRPSGGGRAEVSYPMMFEEPYGHPDPHNWGGARSAEVLGQHTDDLERCLGGQTGVQLTLYVSTGGKVVSAGATSSTLEMYEPAQCIAEAAMEWTFPDPGERPAKAVLEF